MRSLNLLSGHAAVRLCLVLALALFALLPVRPASAQNFIASQIENLISTETLQVEIEGLSGALTGNVRIERLTASDPQGVFLTATDLAMDWSPLSLARSNLAIERLTAAQVVLERLPEGGPATAADGGGFALPSITADIDQIAITEFVLGEAVAGVRARLRADASLVLQDAPTRLEVRTSIERLDQAGQIAANIVFAPGENRLEVDVTASEPAGGIVARLLSLPGAPPVGLTITGSGPLSDFSANGALTVAGEPAATVSARVNDAEGGRRVAATLEVQAQRFVPEQYAAYFTGNTRLETALLWREDGTIVIDQGALTSNELEIAASGTLDLSGSANNLVISARSRQGDALPLSFGAGESAVALQVTSLEGTLAGAIAAANVELTAQLLSADYGEFVARNVNAKATSESFNLNELLGPFSIQATAQSVAAPEGTAERFLQGEVRLTAAGALTPEGVDFSQTQIVTAVASASVTGNATLDFAAFNLALATQFDTAALSAAAIPLAGERLAVNGNIARGADGALVARDLSVQGEGLTIEGSATLAEGNVDAEVTGTIDQAADLNAALSGQARFQLTASGPAAQPDLDISLTSEGLTLGGRQLADLQVTARGTFNAAAPTGVVEISGTLEGQPLSGSARVETLPSGERLIRDLAIRQGPNAITGELRLSDGFAPVGTLEVDVEDIGPLAALALQQASGDLSGQITLGLGESDLPVANVDLTSRALTVAGNVLQGVAIDLAVQDYLGQPFAAGSVSASALAAGGIAVEGLSLDLSRRGDFTVLAASATVNAIPVEIGGRVRFEAEGTTIEVERLSAMVEANEVALAAPTTINIQNGQTSLAGVTLRVGEGSLVLDGQVGETLDLRAALQAVPLAIANPFVADLEASGTISGTASVTGTAAEPSALFRIEANAVATSHTRSAGIPPLDTVLAGSFADGTLTLEDTTLALGEGSLTVSGTIGEALALRIVLDEVPVALANGFVPGLDASGTVSGTATATGSLLDPAADFVVTGTGISAAEVAAAGIPPITLDVDGSYRSGTLTLRTAAARFGTGSITASGTVGDSLDLRLALVQVPVALANGFVPDLNASGIISGTATATGTLTNPDAVFDLSGAGITTEALAGSGIAPVQLRIAGTVADGTARLETAVVNVGNGSLQAAGTIGRELDLRLTLNQIPLGLANAFAPDLQATGLLSGSATATGSFANPEAVFDLSGTGITTAALAAAGVDPIALDVEGRYAEGTAVIETAAAQFGEGSITASGTVGERLDLQLALRQLPVALANDFVPGLGASGTISGSATATGSLSDPVAEFRLEGADITTAQLATSGIAPIDVALAGRFAEGTATIETATAQVGMGSLTASGTVGTELDLQIMLSEIPVGLANGFVPGLGASGTISGSATATGSLSAPVAEFDLAGTDITTAQLAASGVAPIDATLAGRFAEGTATIDTATAQVGTGSLTASGTVGTELDLQIMLSEIPVGLANGFVPGLGASGTITGSATATGSLSNPEAEFDLAGTGITTRQLAASGVPPIRIAIAGDFANGTATIETANAQVGTGTLTATGTVGERLDLQIRLSEIPVGLANGFVPGLGASGTISGTATATGSLSDPVAEFDLGGTGITTRQLAATGVPPIQLAVAGGFADGTATIETATARVGTGSLTASGTVGQSLDLQLVLDDIPVGLANAFVPGLDASGTVSGSVAATGSLADPRAEFDISAANLATAQTRAAGAPPVALTIAGRYVGGTVEIRAATVNAGGGTITASGTAGATLNLTVTLANVPASLLSAVAPDADPQGSISGTLQVSGTTSDPSVTYNLDVTGLSLAQTRSAGVGPLGVSASGQFANNRLTLDAELAGEGIALAAAGSVGLGGTPQLDIAVNGTAPLALANQFLAEDGRSLRGVVTVAARVAGTTASPAVTGTVSTSGAQFVDTGANIAVNDIAATINLNGQTATIARLTGSLSSGGTISVTGTVGLTDGFAANLAARVEDGRYNDGEILSATVDADLTLTGSLTASPLLAGTVNADSINILVPETLPTSLARIDVQHRNARPEVYEQQRRIQPEEASGSGAAGLTLDVTLNAPNEVFVRGRGLDVELGGSIRIRGAVSSPQIIGAFELQRGRFRILGNRIDFERGILTFTGALIPTLDLLATSDTGDVTVNIAVTGPADDPSFSFSSTPALPQDEVLARLIFGQGTADLSPLQIAQLAEAAASLAGVGGSTGLLERLRSQLGVDDLDIRTNADGQTAVGVGKYINDNIYLGVDTTGRVSIDLDLGRDLKARAAVSPDGGGEVGIFYEKEY